MTSAQAQETGSERTGIFPIEVAGVEVLCDWRGAAYVPNHRLLTISDLHFEKGSSFARRGSFVPPYDTHETLGRVARIVEDYDPAVVVCLGDSFHDDNGHDRIPDEIFKDIVRLEDGRDWCWISGNHDPSAPSKLPGFSADELAIGGLVFRHEPHADSAAGEISGHLHPAARIFRRGRTVRRTCFACDRNRLIMPAFGAFTGSLNVLAPAYESLFDWPRMQALLLGDRRIYPIPATHLVPDRSCVIKEKSRHRA
ncbi:MAG: ligase-associated DNA damage response endonuclease PdeM [Rhizobiaceae bacterium]